MDPTDEPRCRRRHLWERLSLLIATTTAVATAALYVLMPLFPWPELFESPALNQSAERSFAYAEADLLHLHLIYGGATAAAAAFIALCLSGGWWRWFALGLLLIAGTMVHFGLHGVGMAR